MTYPKISLYISFLLSFFFGFAFTLYSQQPTFTLDNPITTTSQCAKDGSIKAIVKTKTPTDFIFEYALTPEYPNAPIFPNQSTPLFEFLPAGKYTLTVIGHDPHKLRNDIVRKNEHVVVQGNYQEMLADYVPAYSRASYTTCATGQISIQIQRGRPPYRYEITKAPNPSYIGRSGVSAKAGTITLQEDDYPAGMYQFTVSDACSYTKTISFNLRELTELPKFRYENSNLFTAYAPYNTAVSNEYSCDKPLVKILFDNKTRNNRDLMKTINAGLFEIGIAKPGEQPTSWTTFKYESEYPVSIAPYKLSDYYNTRGKLQVYVRLRRCHNIIYTSPAQFSSPTLENPQITNSANCGYKTITIAPNKLSSGLFCYPLTLTALKDDGSKQIIYGPITINKPGDKSAIIEIPIGTKYKIDVKDADGVQRASYQGEAKGYFNQLGSKKDYCDGWQINFVPDLVSTCSPIKVDIIEEGSTIPIKSYTFTSATHQLSPRLLYNKNYIFHAYLENNPLISYKEIKNNYKSQQKPQLDRITYQISNTPNLAIVSVRELSADPKILRLYRNNELIAETDSKGQTAASFNNIQLPPGNYRIEIIDPICGNSEIPFMAKGGYELKNFSLTTSINCHGGKVTPSGVIYFEGKPQPNNTVFRILSFSPSNPSVSAAIDTRLYRAGEVIQLPNDGDYVISAHWEQTYDRRFPEYSLLGSETFQVKREPLGLSQLDTWAYTCNKRSTGHILVKGKGGTLPYRYELWDKNNTKKLEDATYELGTNDVAHFEYGAAGEQYTLHIIDDCTNFIQAITIADYETYNIGSTPRRVLCIGDVIELHAVRLPNYTWKDPQGHVLSHNQDCTITDAQISNSGKYTIEVTMPYCSTPIKGEVDIQVVPCLAPINPHLMNKAM